MSSESNVDCGFVTAVFFGSGFGVSSFATTFARKSSGPRPLATCASMHSTLSGSRVSRHARRSDSKSTFGAFEGSGIAGLSPSSGSSGFGVGVGSCFVGLSACDWLRCCAATSNAGATAAVAAPPTRITTKIGRSAAKSAPISRTPRTTAGRRPYRPSGIEGVAGVRPSRA